MLIKEKETMMDVRKFKEMTDEELEKFISDNDHNNEYDDEESINSDSLIHIYWDCEKCEAESEKELRYQVRISKYPGNLPFMKNAVSQRILAGDVKPGDYASYLSRPGTSNYPNEYVECISLWCDSTLPDKTTIEWRKTNTDDKSFFVIYDNFDNVNIVRSL